MSKELAMIDAMAKAIEKNTKEISKTVKAAGKVPDKKQTDTIRKLMAETVALEKKYKKAVEENLKNLEEITQELGLPGI